MRIIYHNGRATPLRHPLWDTGQARRAHLLRITPHIFPLHGQHHHTPWWFKDGAPSTALSTALHDGLHGTADSPNPTTRSGHSGLRRQVRLLQTSDTAASHKPDPPGETSVQRCGETHPRRFDIRDLCQPHAHISHGSAILPQGPSGQEINASAPSQVQTGVCPQSRPTFTQQTAAVRATQNRTATAHAEVIPHHFLDAENTFSEGKEDPTHLSWASRSGTPAHVPDINALSELSPCNGTSAILGQHGACPDRDDI